MITLDDLISVIVPVYNLEQYIAKCIDSLLSQTYKNIEIVLVDNASTDNSSKICSDYALHNCNIQYIGIEQNRGVVHARNVGIQNAKGKYIGFVDGDDWIENTMYEELAKHISTAQLVSCGVFRQYSENREEEIRNVFLEGLYEGEKYGDVINSMIYDTEQELVQPMTPWIYNKLYLREIVEKIYMDVNEQIAYGEDSVFLYKYMMKSKSVYFVDDCLYHYRYRVNSAWHAKNDNILIHINLVYLSLMQDFTKSRQSRSLVYQLQKWVSVVVCNAINRHMGFDQRIRIPQFLLDMGGLYDKKIALYGAGQMGKDFYWQLLGNGYHVVAWLDRDSCIYQREGLEVYNPEYLLKVAYDMVLIAVKSDITAEKIRKDLILLGVDKTKICWKKPLAVY